MPSPQQQSQAQAATRFPHPLQPTQQGGKVGGGVRRGPRGKGGNPAVLPLLKSSLSLTHPITTLYLIIKLNLPVTSQHGSNSSSLEAFFVYFHLFIYIVIIYLAIQIAGWRP